MALPVRMHVSPDVESAPREVLVVNSDPAMRMRIGGLLRAAGFSVVACATGAEALALLEAAPRQAVVVDQTNAKAIQRLLPYL